MIAVPSSNGTVAYEKVLIRDGYGQLFDPAAHARHVRAIFAVPDESPPPAPTEPVWKDYPAGRSRCPPLAIDTDCERGVWA
jgi:hypothetical protein